MIFLTEKDLKARILTKFLNDATSENPDILEDIELETISIFKDHLSNKFDIDELFSKTGDERSKTLVKYMSDIVVYELVTANPTRKVAEKYDRKFKIAKSWLLDCFNGKITPVDFELKKEGHSLHFGNNRNTNYYY